jgi:hypothetical protein
MRHDRPFRKQAPNASVRPEARVPGRSRYGGNAQFRPFESRSAFSIAQKCHPIIDDDAGRKRAASRGALPRSACACQARIGRGFIDPHKALQSERAYGDSDSKPDQQPHAGCYLSAKADERRRQFLSRPHCRNGHGLILSRNRRVQHCVRGCGRSSAPALAASTRLPARSRRRRGPQPPPDRCSSAARRHSC